MSTLDLRILQLRALCANTEAQIAEWTRRAAQAETIPLAAEALTALTAAQAKLAGQQMHLRNAEELQARFPRAHSAAPFPPAAPVLAKETDARLVTSSAAPAAQPGSL